VNLKNVGKRKEREEKELENAYIRSPLFKVKNRKKLPQELDLH
jgi:hypothetical protein